MAKYRISSPDGSTYEITAPDGASQADILAFAQQHHAAQTPPTLMQEAQASKLGRVVQGMRDPVDALAQLAPRGLSEVTSLGETLPNPVSKFFDSQAAGVDALNKKNEGDYQASRAAAGNQGFDLARLGGNIASPVNFAGGEAASALPKAGTLLGKIAQAAGVGATMGATQPVTDTSNFASEKLKQMALAGATGGIAPVAGKAISSVLNPQVSSDAQALLAKGIRLTPGQIMGGGWQGAEDKIASIPVVGSFVSNSQRQATEDFNRTVLNSALQPIGATLRAGAPVGRKGIDAVASKIGDVYDFVLPKMTGQLDTPFATDLQSIANSAVGQGSAQSTIDRLGNVIKAQLMEKADPNGAFSGDTLKGIQSEIGRLSSKYSGSDSADDRDLGGLLQDVHGAFRDMLARNNPQYIDQLNSADAAWAQYARIRRAASAIGAKDGVFSGSQYANAVRASDQSVGKGAYAKGQAFMQDLSDPAKNILPSTVPDSGTAGRLMMGTALAGGHLVAPQAALPLSALTALYTRPGQALARAALAQRPLALRAAGSAVGNMNPIFPAIPLASLSSLLAPSGVGQGN